MDEDSKLVVRDDADERRYAEGLLYDFAKFLTTLSILALGGVLTLTETADRADIKTGNIIMITAALTLALAISAVVASTIAVSRSAGEALPANLHRFIYGSVSLLGMGLGMFVYMWVDKLS